MKVFKNISIVIVLGAILGFFMSMFRHNGLLLLLGQSLKSFNVFLYFIVIIFSFFLIILIHELGHLISFLISGIKIRALFVLAFIIKKDEDNKWRFQFYKKNIKLIGGLVVPNLGSIENEEDYNKVKRAFSKALLDGPIASVVYFILVLVSFFCVWIFTNNQFMITMLFLHLIVTTLMTILIILSSKVNTKDIYGDFVAYDKMKNDKVFALSIINQYRMFSLIESKSTEDYLASLIVKEYEDKNYPTYNSFDLSLITNYLSHNIRKEILDTKLDKYINSLNIYTLAHKEEGLDLAYLISAYEYKKGNVEGSYKLFERINNYESSSIDPKSKEFYIKSYEHLLNLSNNTNYLKDNFNILLKNVDILLPVINTKEILEDLIKPLTLQQYVSSIDNLSINKKNEI